MSTNSINISRFSNEYDTDAWGRPKAIIDKSILHGMFTYNVPVTTWYENINNVEQSSFIYSTSVDGALRITSNGIANDSIYLRTFRNPRYIPNRGHLYSSSIILPNINNQAVRRFGFFTAESGAFFELDTGVLYAVTRTTISDVTTDTRHVIDVGDIELENGNVFDIQMQWRGVGSYTFFINLQPVKLLNYLGSLTNLSIFNPATPIAFECINKGDDGVIKCGCVDISSEGGGENGSTYGSISIDNENGQVAISGYNVPILAIRSKDIVGGKINTRDTLALLASAYSDNKSVFRVWATRDKTAITVNNQSWADYGDGHLEYITYDTPNVTTPMTFDTTKADAIFTCRVGQDTTYATSALFEGRTHIYMTPADILIFTMHRESGTGATVGVTFEFAEEI